MHISEIWSFIKSIFTPQVIIPKSEVSLDFQYLTPSKNAENVEVYLSSLNEAMKNENVKNIAISGSYGAGKSSFLKTFEYTYQTYNFLDISLATFIKDEKDLSLIEKSILQQIFYKVEQNQVPFSRFKRISQVSGLTSKTILVLVTIFASLVFFDSNHIHSNIKSNFIVLIFSILTLILASFFFIRTIIKNFTGITLEKLNLQNLEISTNKPNENSLLNKYLDEIIYFFSTTKYNVVVFQDLDRFDNVEIFTKLRELNNFLNNSEQVRKQHKKIVFIYAIKDEMFKNENSKNNDENSRTKFFDFMIPIIPFVNASNSYDKLLLFFDNELKNLSHCTDKQSLDSFKEFLRDISLYINDMRLLKNIYNEYKIYDAKIGQDLDKVKILAMMVYKNFYPEDFSLLHKNEGLISNIFRNKNTLIKNENESYGQQIIEKNNQVTNIEHESITSINELRKIYIYTIIEAIENNPPYFRVDNHNIYFNQAIRDENFKLIQNSNQIRHPSYSNYNTTFIQIENNLGNYAERETLINNKQADRMQILKHEIKNIKDAQYDLNTKTLHQLCYIEKIKNKIIKQLENKELLQFLIINGHIDENYYMFLSYSFHKSLTPNDTYFLKAVIINDVMKAQLSLLTNIKEVINKLTISEYQKPAVLNKSIIEFLIENQQQFKSQYEAIFKQITNNSDYSKKFIFDYIDYLPLGSNFIQEIAERWTEIWSYIYTNKNFHSTQKEIYFYELFYNLSLLQIIKLNQNNTLKLFLENLTKLKNLAENDNEKMKSLLSELDIKFAKLNEPISNRTLFAHIYENNLYILNKLMIEQIIYTKYAVKEDIEEELNTKHLSTIKSLDMHKKLITRIENNVSSYIDEIFLTIGTNKKEDAETIIWLLNNENLATSQKIKIIDFEDTIIEDISQIKDTKTYEQLFKNKKVRASWENIGLYYNLTSSLTNILIEYLKDFEVATALSQTRVNSKYLETNQNFQIKLLKEILLCNNFDIKSYKLYIKANGYWYDDLKLCEVNEEKIDALIDGGKLQFTIKNFESLIKCSNSKQIVFIEKHFDDFIDKYEDLKNIFEEQDYIKLLESEKLNSEQKMRILEKLNIESFNITEDLSQLLSELYLTNNKSMSYSLLRNILPLLPQKIKLGTLVTQLEHNEFSNVEINEILNELSYPYNRLCLKIGSFEKIPNTGNNLRLVVYLKRRNCISSFSTNEKSIRVNRFK